MRTPTNRDVMTRRLQAGLGGLLVLVVAGALLQAAPSSRAEGVPARHHCADWRASACQGTIAVPLDRGDPSRGTTTVGFTLLPRADVSRPAQGTIVGAVGGPGVNDLEVWREPLAAALDRFDLLVMDYRGVGRSDPLRCDGLDDALAEVGWTPAAIRACGDQLGDTARRYSTSAAAADLVDVLDALDVATIDLVGQSYGTFFGQAFALRHPERLRTLVIEGVHPLDVDPWERDQASWPRGGMRQVCGDSVLCDGGDPAADWAALVDRVRAHDDGVTVDDLRTLQQFFPGFAIGRELIAATRAHLRGDRAPLERLIAQARDFQERYAAREAEEPPGPRPEFSPAMAFAVTCNDSPMPFDRAAAPEVRRAQFDAALAALPADSYAPFTVEEATGGRFSLSWGRLCVDWPSPGPAAPPPPVDGDYPDVPTLVLNGALDSATPASGAARVAARFPTSRLVVIPFGDHFNLPVLPCVSSMVVDFIVTADLDRADAEGCRGTDFRALGSFPRTLDDVRPAQDDPGGQSSRRSRQLAAAAAATVADAAARRAPDPDLPLVIGDEQPGLRGGTVTFDDRGLTAVITLDDVEYVEGVPVSGSVVRDLETGEVAATVTVDGPARGGGTLEMTWDADQPDALATIAGRLHGRPLRATTPVA